MSGYHIYEQAARNGQPFLIALFYPFVVDFPSVLAAFILVHKDVSQANGQKVEETEQAPAKAVKKAVPAKPTPARANGTSKTNLAKTASPAKAVKPKEIVTMFQAPVIDTEVVN